MKDIVLVVPQAEHVAFLFFLNYEIAANREIHNRRGNVAHVGGFVDQSTDLPRRQLVWRLVLRGNRTKAGITAPRPPQIEHQSENSEGNEEDRITAERTEKLFGGRRLMDEAFVESDGNGHTF